MDHKPRFQLIALIIQKSRLLEETNNNTLRITDTSPLSIHRHLKAITIMKVNSLTLNPNLIHRQGTTLHTIRP